MTGVTVAGVLAAAIDASAGGQLDRVLIAMLALLALASFEAVAPLAAAARELSATLASGRRLLELTTREAAVRDPATPTPPPAWPFTLALDNSRARYPDQPDPALDGVSLRLAPGERVALVGPSGAGKTTVTNLLLRFLDPEAGRVTLAQRDLRDYALADVRRAIAVAGQESHLFSASIRDNVAPAPPGRERRGARARPPPRPDLGLDPSAPGRPGHVRRRGGPRAVGRPATTARPRASPAGRRAGAGARRADRPPRPGTASELLRDVFAAAARRTVLLITHRDEGLDLVDRVVNAARRSDTGPRHPKGMRRSPAPRARVAVVAIDEPWDVP